MFGCNNEVAGIQRSRIARFHWISSKADQHCCSLAGVIRAKPGIIHSISLDS